MENKPPKGYQKCTRHKSIVHKSFALVFLSLVLLRSFFIFLNATPQILSLDWTLPISEKTIDALIDWDIEGDRFPEIVVANNEQIILLSNKGDSVLTTYQTPFPVKKLFAINQEVLLVLGTKSLILLKPQRTTESRPEGVATQIRLRRIAIWSRSSEISSLELANVDEDQEIEIGLLVRNRLIILSQRLKVKAEIGLEFESTQHLFQIVTAKDKPGSKKVWGIFADQQKVSVYEIHLKKERLVKLWDFSLPEAETLLALRTTDINDDGEDEIFLLSSTGIRGLTLKSGFRFSSTVYRPTVNGQRSTVNGFGRVRFFEISAKSKAIFIAGSRFGRDEDFLAQYGPKGTVINYKFFPGLRFQFLTFLDRFIIAGFADMIKLFASNSLKDLGYTFTFPGAIEKLFLSQLNGDTFQDLIVAHRDETYLEPLTVNRGPLTVDRGPLDGERLTDMSDENGKHEMRSIGVSQLSVFLNLTGVILKKEQKAFKNFALALRFGERVRANRELRKAQLIAARLGREDVAKKIEAFIKREHRTRIRNLAFRSLLTAALAVILISLFLGFFVKPYIRKVRYKRGQLEAKRLTITDYVNIAQDFIALDHNYIIKGNLSGGLARLQEISDKYNLTLDRDIFLLRNSKFGKDSYQRFLNRLITTKRTVELVPKLKEIISKIQPRIFSETKEITYRELEKALAWLAKSGSGGPEDEIPNILLLKHPEEPSASGGFTSLRVFFDSSIYNRLEHLIFDHFRYRKNRAFLLLEYSVATHWSRKIIIRFLSDSEKKIDFQKKSHLLESLEELKAIYPEYIAYPENETQGFCFKDSEKFWFSFNDLVTTIRKIIERY